MHVKEYLKGITVYEEIMKSFTGPELETDTVSSGSPKILHTEL